MKAIEYHKLFNKTFARMVARKKTSKENMRLLLVMLDTLNEKRASEGIEPLTLPTLEIYRNK